MTDQAKPPEEPLTRAMVFDVISAGVASGLPAPKGLRFHGNDGLTIHLDKLDDLFAWEPTFEVGSDRYTDRRAQPYPLDGPDYREWCTRTSTRWHGWVLTLAADDPITNENLRYWIESGQAAKRAAYVASQAAEGGDQA